MNAARPWETLRAGAILLLCLLPLVWKASVPDSTFHMEVMSLMPSQETWLRCHEGDARAWVVPSWNGRPRLNKPPMLVWLNLLAWRGLHPESASVDDLVGRARLFSAGLAGLGLVGVYAMGRLLGGPPLAWRATLVAGTTFFFTRQGRLASYDTHLFAWASLAVAMLWRAVKSVQSGERSQAAVWAFALLGGAFTASAVLTKGPIAFLFVLVPLGTILWALSPPRKFSCMLVLLVLAAALALASPWYAYVLHAFPGVGRVLLIEYRQARQHAQFPLYYLVLLALVFPWSFPLAGTCGALFSGSFRKTLARKDWIPLVWLLAILLVMSLPEAKRERYVFPVLPAAALLVAQGWLWQEACARTKSSPPGWQRLLRKAHFTVLLGSSAAVALFPAVQAFLLERGFLKQTELPGLGWKTALPAGLVLLCLACSALMRARARRVSAALALSAVWMISASTFIFNFYVHSHHGCYKGRTAAEQTALLTQDAKLFWLCVDPKSDTEPDQKFLLYSRRTIPRIGPEDLEALVESNAKVALITATDKSHSQVASRLGLELAYTFNDGRKERSLWLQKGPSSGGVSPQGPP